MKKLSLLAGLLATVALSTAAASTAAVTTNGTMPFSTIEFVPCAADGAGELVSISGDLHVLMTSTINGNNISGKVHFQPQGLKGTGLTTGDTYNATGVTQESFKSSLQNGQFNDTFVNNFRLIGHGPNNNLLVHQTVHVTFNAKGVLTADVENSSIECR
jgi:hypothetical protein